MATDLAVINLTAEDVQRIAHKMWEEPVLPPINSERIASYYVGIDNGEPNPPIQATVTTTGNTWTGDGNDITHWIYPDSGTITIPEQSGLVPRPFWQNEQVPLDPVPFGARIDPNANRPFPNIFDTIALQGRVQELENKITMLEAIIREHIDRTKPLIVEPKSKRSVIIEED